MKKQAFTVVETTIVIVILGILAACLLAAVNPGDVREKTFAKAGVAMMTQIDFATRHLLAKNAKDFTMERLFDDAGEFSITSTGAAVRLVELYRQYLAALRTQTQSSYLESKILSDSRGSEFSQSISSAFPNGFSVRNGSYVAFRLYKGCKDGDDTAKNNVVIYNPLTPSLRVSHDYCGLIFFDVNGVSGPNALGQDQYIVALGKGGLK